MSLDILSDVLRSVRLVGRSTTTSAAVASGLRKRRRLARIAWPSCPPRNRVMEYHVVLSGSCWAAIVGEAPVRLEGGLVLFHRR